MLYLFNGIIRNFLDGQYITISKLQNVSKLPVFILLPYLGVHNVRLKKKLNQFLSKMYPILMLGLFVNQSNTLKISFPLRIVP